jgi:hypothetical protein
VSNPRLASLAGALLRAKKKEEPRQGFFFLISFETTRNLNENLKRQKSDENEKLLI